MANPSKAKGSAFENKIKVILADHYKIQFERVPLSGSLAYLKGDLWAPHNPEFPYCIECKHHEEVNWNSILVSKSSNLLDFWQQSLDNAKVMKKKPLLIYRWDRSKDYICWDDDVNLDHQIHYKGFGFEFKMGELLKWLPQSKLKSK